MASASRMEERPWWTGGCDKGGGLLETSIKFICVSHFRPSKHLKRRVLWLKTLCRYPVGTIIALSRSLSHGGVDFMVNPVPL
jgi:hypothetical protein